VKAMGFPFVLTRGHPTVGGDWVQRNMGGAAAGATADTWRKKDGEG